VAVGWEMEKSSIEIPYAIGQKVWWIGNGYQKETIKCPECLGSGHIKMVRGDGQVFDINCACCSHGYEQPRGTIERTFYKHEPTIFIPETVSLENSKVIYHGWIGYLGSVKVEDLFSDKEECLKKCDAKNKEKNEWEEKMRISNLKGKRRDLACSVHYWAGQLKKYERNAEDCRERLGICKEKAKAKSSSDRKC